MTQEMMSFSEIGRRLGIATQSVVQIYEMAMRKLKKIMLKDKDRFMLDVERGVDDEIFGV